MGESKNENKKNVLPRQEPRFFYTVDYINRWTSGPSINFGDPDNQYAPIATLERAQELAEAVHDPRNMRDAVIATYGASWEPSV